MPDINSKSRRSMSWHKTVAPCTDMTLVQRSCNKRVGCLKCMGS